MGCCLRAILAVSVFVDAAGPAAASAPAEITAPFRKDLLECGVLLGVISIPSTIEYTDIRINVEENETALTTVTASDLDLPGDTLSFAINGGADAALFDIVASAGVLTFKTAPVVATPTDANTDNVYEVTVEVSDAGDPVGMDSQCISVTVIEHIVDEQDYEDFANSPGTFPSTASADDKKADTDFDGDGMTNEEEFAAGTDPKDPYDYFWSLVSFDPVEGFKIVFCPYIPELNDYTLMSAFGGSNNHEATNLNYSAQPFEDDATMGCFIVPPLSGGALESLFLMVNTLKHSL